MRARESGKYQACKREKQREPEQCLEVASKYLQHIDGDCAGGDCRRAERCTVKCAENSEHRQ